MSYSFHIGFSNYDWNVLHKDILIFKLKKHYKFYNLIFLYNLGKTWKKILNKDTAEQNLIWLIYSLMS